MEEVMLVLDAKVFYLSKDGYEKPKFSRPPTVFVSPVNKDVEMLNVQFCERWHLDATGSDGALIETLLFSNTDCCSKRKTTQLFEVKLKLAVPCRLYGSNDKSGWHGVVIRELAETKAWKRANYWKDLTLGKVSPRTRFNGTPFKKNQDQGR
jgi:hypothetical protein